MSTTHQIKFETMHADELLEDGSRGAIREFADMAMFPTACQALRRAGVKAELFEHGAVYNLHLLTGVLSLGSTDPDLGVPRTLSKLGFGFDFSETLAFLGSQEHLRRANVGMPIPSKELVHTLGEALKLSRRRPEGHWSHGVIITADLVLALMDATTTDPLLDEAFKRAGGDMDELRKKLASSNADESSVRHLNLVTTD